MKSKKIKWNVLCQSSDNLVRGFTFHGQFVYAITHTGAPKYKVVRTDASILTGSMPQRRLWPKGPDSIQSLTKCRHYLLIVYSNGVVGRLVKYDQATGTSSENQTSKVRHHQRQLPGLAVGSLPGGHHFLDFSHDDL